MSLRSSVGTSGTFDASGNAIVSVPTGVQAGDMLLCHLVGDLSAGTGNYTCTGWTEIANLDTTADGSVGRILKKVAGASEPATYTFTFTGTPAITQYSASMAAWIGRSNTPVVGTVNVQNTFQDGSSVPVPVTALGVTANAGDDLAWFGDLDFQGVANWSFAAATGMTLDVSQSDAVWQAVGLSTKDNLTAGATGNISANASFITGNSFTGWASVLITLPVGAPIVYGPVNQQAPDTGSATFAVTATGTPTLTYQWQDNRTGSFTNITGAISASLTVSGVGQAFQGRQYRCIVTDGNSQSTTSSVATLAVVSFPLYLLSKASQVGNDIWLRDPTTISGGSTFTLSPGGTLLFSGATSEIRTKIDSAGGTLVFSGAPAQIHTKVDSSGGTLVFSGSPTQQHTRLQVPGGTLVFSGAVTINHVRAFVPTGTLVFSGAANVVAADTFQVGGILVFSGSSTQLHTKVFVPGGTLVFSGTAPITTGGTNTYTLSPGGTLVFSGTDILTKIKQLVPSGLALFSGAVSLLKTKLLAPSGTLLFSGVINELRTKILSPSGLLLFSGSAGISFIPFGSATITSQRKLSGFGI
jgi:hypothetical protein